MWEPIFPEVQTRSMSLFSVAAVLKLLLFMEAIFMYSGWSKLVGEMQEETERDLNLVWSNLELGTFLFSLLEFLDLDCWDRFLFRACLGSPISGKEDGYN